MNKNNLGALLCSMFLSVNSFATPLSLDHKSSLSTMKVFQMTPVDTQALLRSAMHGNSRSNYPFQIGSALHTHIEIQEWELVKKHINNSDPIAVMRYKISSPGATNLSLGFSEFFMPQGAKTYVYTPDGSEVLKSFGHEENESHGQLWTPILSGDEVVVEVNSPAHLADQVKITLQQVNHGFRGGKPTSSWDKILISGSCNVDVACSAGNGWQDQINSVGHYSFSTNSGSYVCTGAAINNTREDNRRLFLTADHCLEQASHAATVVVYWKYENSRCREPGSSDSGGRGDGPRNINQSGAVMLAQSSRSDFALIELDDPIPEAANVYFAGWNRSSNTPSSATSIHHPSGNEKRISHDFDPLTRQSTHWQIEDWDVGTTEGGSSGSPLFDSSKRIIGQLTGGLAACGNNEYDVYGRMDVNWNYGIASFLDPLSSGVMQLNGRYSSDSISSQSSDNTMTIENEAENLSQKSQY